MCVGSLRGTAATAWHWGAVQGVLVMLSEPSTPWDKAEGGEGCQSLVLREYRTGLFLTLLLRQAKKCVQTLVEIKSSSLHSVFTSPARGMRKREAREELCLNA